MHGLLSIERAEPQPHRHYRTHRGGERRASESGQETGAGSVPAEQQFDCGRLGHRGESAPGSSFNTLSFAGTGADEAVSADSAALDSTAAGGERGSGFIETIVLGLIRFYQSSLSPAIPSSCRFYPTCSSYAYDAVSTWGVRHGSYLALRRVLRCRPFGAYGCDPVPGREDAPAA
jgi:uncharacterized protein